MNYEEKYNEILEWARKNKARLNGVSIEEVLPELAESEDERVRKRAIAILKQQRDYWSYDGPVNKFPPATPRKDLVDAIDVALAYLEKQKEPVVDKEGMYYYLGGKFIYCGYPATEENPYDFAMSQQEKQKEQKPAEWSEEDEDMIRDIIASIDDLI